MSSSLSPIRDFLSFAFLPSLSPPPYSLFPLLCLSLTISFLPPHPISLSLALSLLLSQLPTLRQNPSGSQLRLKAAVLCMITAPSADNMLPVNKSINSRHLFLGKLSSLHTQTPECSSHTHRHPR